MTAYYNEIDPYAAQWLRNLISAGHIAPGVVDERDMRDIRPDELMGYTQCHFFAGIGVWSYALRRAGWSDERPIWTGSCPCQPFSAAGKGEGFDDERHLWPHLHWLVEQCGPPIVIGEQVASKDGLEWIDLVSSDMEGTGYAFGASDLCAAGFDGAHIRQRLYWLAYSESIRLEGCGSENQRRRTEGMETCRPHGGSWSDRQPDDGGSPLLGRVTVDWLEFRDNKWRPVEPSTLPLAHAAPSAMGRMRAYGNALDAETATQFCSVVMESIGDMAVDQRNCRLI